MATTLDLSQILIAENLSMQESIFAANSGEIVWNVMDRANVATRLSCVRKHYEGYAVKVEPELFGWLYDIMSDVKRSLQIDEEIDLFIVNNNECNAVSYTSAYADDVSIVAINSGLIDRLTRDELYFVIGHEIGHIIASNPQLNDVLSFLYNDDKPQPDILQRRMMLITQLSELEADRFGYLAMPDVRVCASAMFKLQSGVDPKFSYQEIEKFLLLNKQRVDHIVHDNGTSRQDHPADPIRIEAIRLFSQRDKMPEDEYEKAMYELYDVHAKLMDSELESHIGLFIATGGLLISRLDGEISEQELDRICSMLSCYYMFPFAILNQLMAEEDTLQERFEGAIRNILDADASLRPQLIGYLAGYLATDEHLSETEVEFVMNCGTTLLDLSEDEVVSVIATTLRNDFQPSTALLASVMSGVEESEEETE